MKKIKAFVFDVDGVFSHNIYINSIGEQWRSMNTKDGYAIQYAIKKNYYIAIITGAYCEGIKIRFNGLGVKDIYLQVPKKIMAVEDFLKKYNLDYSELLYMGDDIPDYEPMLKAGIASCPSDAANEIKQIATLISSYKGGEGCVRDVIEKVLKSQNNWFDKDSFEW
ncbi:MAG: HAD hydrolase family protein [Bacteroidales bacterium]|nr:HAD hydrolase family protein [Bacteroidales bacterium]